MWSWMGRQSDQPPLDLFAASTLWRGVSSQVLPRPTRGPVWSADLPGYGGSDPLGDAPTVGGFTRAMSPLLAASSTPVWLTGFHSGALVAIDMAQSFPEQVAGLVLVDVPVFAGARHGITARITDHTASVFDTGRSVKRAFPVDGC